MNEILRFKKGRMIPKAEDGIKTERRTPGGQIIYETEDRGEGFFTKLGRWLTTPLTTGTTPGGQTYSLAGPANNFDASKWQSSNGTRQRTPEEEAKLKDPKVQAYLQRQQKEAETRATAPLNAGENTGSKSVVRRTGINWGNEFTNFMGGLSQEQQDWLKQNGLDNAQALQTYLDANNYYDSTGNNVDNKFGRNSKRAWDKFVASDIMGKNRDEEILKEKQQAEPVVDAPDPFGYKTSNHYGDGFALKNMGFSNYAGLQKFAMGDDQFAKDLRERFGQDVSQWDQAAVEGALNVNGRYRGGRSGDFGDMARSMQDWAAKKNAAYDQKELASRTGASGTTYSSPEMMKKFESIKVSPEVKYGLSTKFDFSNMKFNSGFGNTSANTLGDAGVGTMNPLNNWMQFAAQSDYLPQQ